MQVNVSTGQNIVLSDILEELRSYGIWPQWVLLPVHFNLLTLARSCLQLPICTGIEEIMEDSSCICGVCDQALDVQY